MSLWMEMAKRQKRGVDALIVDSASPMMPTQLCKNLYIEYFSDNIGHLSRGGRDGWGRAFCHGLSHADQYDYDYVAHVEGDSLLKLDVSEIIDDMEEWGTKVASIPVSSMPKWVETGLMFFSVDWVRSSHIVDRYDWKNREKYPEPERVIGGIVGRDLTTMPWTGMRDDFHELTVDNVHGRKLDWLTHAPIAVMERFAQ